MRTYLTVLLASVFLALFLALAGCGGGSEEEETPQSRCGFPEDFVGPLPEHCYGG